LIVDSTSNRLIATAPVAGQLDSIEEVIKKIDTASDSESTEGDKTAIAQKDETRVVRLKFGMAGELSGLIDKSFANQRAALRIQADDRSNSLVLTGKPGTLEAAAQLIGELDARPEEAQKQIRFIEIKSGDVEAVAATVRELFSEFIRNRGGGGGGFRQTRTRIIPDAATSRLILCGSKEEMDQIATIIEQIDKPSDQPTGLRIFRLKSSNAYQLQQIIVNYLNTREGRKRGAARPWVSVDEKNSSLIVAGSNSDIQQAASLIEHLDNGDAKEPREMKAFQVKAPSMYDFTRRLKELYVDMLRSTPESGAADANFFGDDYTGRLIVSAGKSQMPMIEKILATLEQPITKSEFEMRIFKLKSANAQQLVGLVYNALAYREQRWRGPRPWVNADDRNNSLMVAGTKADIDQAAAIIEKLDSAEQSSEARQVRVFAVKGTYPSEFARRMKELYVDQIKGQTNAGPADANFIPDDYGGRVIVAASQAQMPFVEKLMGTLDEKLPGSEVQIQVFHLKSANATQLSPILYNAIVSREPRYRGPRPFVNADEQDNSLMVVGNKADIEQAKSMIEQMDSGPAREPRQVRVFPVKTGSPSEFARRVKELYIDQLKGQTNAGPADATFMGDDYSAKLIVAASESHMAFVEKLLGTLQQDVTVTDAELRIFKLENSDATEVAGVITQLIQGLARSNAFGTRGNRETFSFSPDTRSNSLIIFASKNYFKVIEQLLQTLDQSKERTDREVRFYTLTNANAFDVSFKLDTMFAERSGENKVVTDADLVSNTLTVFARKKDVAEIEDIITRMDQSARDTSMTVRMITVGLMPVEQMAAMLNNIYPQMSKTELKRVDRLPPRDKPAPTGKDSGKGPTNDVPSSVSSQATPDGASTNPPPHEVFFTVDKKANALILSGPVQELDKIESMVSSLAASFNSNESEIRLFQLKEADPVVVARMLNDLFRTTPGQAQTGGRGPGGIGRRQRLERQEPVPEAPPQGQQGQQPPPPPKITAVAEPRTHSVVIRARPADFILFENLIQQLDAGGLTAQLEHRLIPLEHTHADKMLVLIRQMLTQLNEVKPGEPVAIAADSRSKSIFAIARDSILNQIEDLVAELDTPAEFEEIELKTFALKNATASQLAQLLKDMLSPGRAGELTPEARELQDQVQRMKIRDDKGQPVVLDLTHPIKILADPAQGGAGGANRLIVGSSTNNIKAMASLIGLLDTVPLIEGITVRMIRLKNVETALVMQTLNSIFQQGQQMRGGRGQGQGQGQGGRGAGALANPLNVAADERANTLILSGQKESLELAQQIVKDLDMESDVFVTEVRLFHLTNASPSQLAPVLRSIFSETGAGGSRASGGQASRLKTVLDDKPAKTTEKPASRAALVIQPDEYSATLIVAARSDIMPLLEDIILKLDGEPAGANGVIQTFTLKYAEAQRVATMLRSLIEQGVYRPGAPTSGQGAGRRTSRDALAVATDVPSNTLIISASPENLAIVKELIKQLDTAENKDFGDIKMFPLKHAKASTLSSVLEQFFRAKRQGEANLGTRERATPVTVTADDRSNTLIVTAGKESLAALERMIEQLDSQEAVSKTNFRVFPLKRTTAVKLQSTLQRLFTNRPARIKGEPAEPISVVADSWANVLIVGGSVDDMVMVESLIERLDSEQTEPGIEVQVFVLAKADARRVSQTIQFLFRGAAGGAGGAAPQSGISVNVDERLNAIVVSAGESDIKRIAELVKKLDTDQVARIAEIRVFPLKYARAAELSTILNSVLNSKPLALAEENPNRASLLQFITRSQEGKDLVATALKEGVQITPDPRTNALIISAPLDYMEMLEQIINHLDQSAPQIAKIRVFNLKNADARQMSLVLSSLFRLQATGGVGTGANQRSVQYSLVKPSADKNTSPKSDDSIGLEEDGGDLEDPAAIVGSAEQQALTVTVDLRTNSLLVGGTEHYVGLASQIIETLDATEAQERKSEVYRLKNSKAVDVQNALRTFLTQDMQKIVTVLGATGAGAAQSILDREVSIVAEALSNSLLLSASPRYFPEVKAMIEQLDQPQPQVLIQALLIEVTLDSTTDLGVEWTYNNSIGNSTVKTGTDFGVADALSNFGGYSAAVTGGKVNFLLRALQNEGKLEVLSRPQILTADNQEASINIGQRIPLVSDTRVTDQNTTLSSFKYENVGVSLTVTPRISPDGFVKMDIGQTNSQISSSKVDVSKGVSIPIINQRSATTTVSVQSGQSILIGGLISTTDDVRSKKIPLLGSIPGLGFLFRSKTTAHERKELLIILTPQILVQAPGKGKSIDAREMTEQQLKSSTIRDNPRTDKLQKEMLDPVLPERNKDDKNRSKAPKKSL
jgi:type II secretion system protein D